MSVAASGADLDGASVEERIARLEHDWGDLDDPGNPLGAEQFVAADAERRPLPAAERLLDDFRLNAEFVPGELGGRLLRLDALARVLRSVFRRDASLGMGYGMSSYMAAAVVWAGGSAEQRRATAELLLSGGRMVCAYPEPAEGNDFLQNSFTTTPSGDGFLLSGRKEALNNASRASSLLLFAHPAGEAVDGHSAYLVRAPEPGSPGFRSLPRRSTVGLRGCLVNGVEFTGYGLTADQLLGPPGAGAELAARAFPVIRCVGPSMALGCADTALRTAVAFARSHRSRSRASLRTPRTRAALVDAFTDLLLCDTLALVATRGLHLLPREGPTLSAVVKYLLPTVLTEMVYDLSIVLGAESYASQGPYAVFQKSARDLPMIGLGPVGSTASRAAIVTHLRRLPGLRAPVDEEVPAALFQPFGQVLPGLRPEELTRAADVDSLLGTLESTLWQASAADGGELEKALAGYAAALDAELARLRRASADLADRPEGGPGLRGFALAERYALITAGAACLGVRRYHSGSPDDFLSGPAWAVMVLFRILRRLDPGTPEPPRVGEEQLLDELLHRFDDARSYDLYATLIGR
ncbi:acyl-CoA dehydrogenase [Streptomyces sp. ME02-8801-2C]|uniref:acyl-CoA dehydrogenase n=1 Tax=Streptomyces sp. ME02-8801-2C TaxID=3028680 RepID=UPI0029BB1381|nr:acyl-CoA dehydrogenase [Streptomyces sp. ME02-8801-2C]MDX3457599.1 acyl-CoA dehydrogenase [Streptomyces sp. ME02-8801-2C]